MAREPSNSCRHAARRLASSHENVKGGASPVSLGSPSVYRATGATGGCGGHRGRHRRLGDSTFDRAVPPGRPSDRRREGRLHRRPPDGPELRSHPRRRLLQAGFRQGAAVRGSAAQRMVEFCAEHDVAHEVCGKVVVAVTADEQPRLAELHRRCVANGVDVELIGAGSASPSSSLTPSASQALHVKVTGIADFSGVMPTLAMQLVDRGRRGLAVDLGRPGRSRTSNELVVETTGGAIAAGPGRQLRRAARRPRSPGCSAGAEAARGMHDRAVPRRVLRARAVAQPPRALADLPGARPAVPVPRRAPHPRRRTGASTPGPNAVLALAREGYSWRVVDRHDLAETLRFSGFRTLAQAQLALRTVGDDPLGEPAALRRRAPPPRARRSRATTSNRHRVGCAPRRCTPTAAWPTTSSSPAATTAVCCTCSTRRHRRRRPRWPSATRSPPSCTRNVEPQASPISSANVCARTRSTSK